MKVVSIRFFVIAIVVVLTLPIACEEKQSFKDQYIKVESFKLGYGTSSRDSISLYLLNEKQSRTSDSIIFVLNVEDRSYHDIPNLHANISLFGNQLFATRPFIPPMFKEKIIDIKISSSDIVRTKFKSYPPQSELAELFYVQKYNEYSYSKIEELNLERNGSNTMEITTYLIFRDSIQPIVNQQFTFIILMSDSAEFTVTSPFMSLE